MKDNEIKVGIEAIKELTIGEIIKLEREIKK